MEKKWFYIGNYGVLANGDQIDKLKDHCNDKGPEDARQFKSVPFHVIYNMIEESKKAVSEPKKEDKPKRKRRTKAEIEEAKKSEN